jgi:hypothetical protein
MSLNHPHERGDESSACVWDYCEVLLRWDDIELDFDCGPAFETLQTVLVLFHYCSVQGNPTLLLWEQVGEAPVLMCLEHLVGELLGDSQHFPLLPDSKKTMHCPSPLVQWAILQEVGPAHVQVGDAETSAMLTLMVKQPCHCHQSLHCAPYLNMVEQASVG